MLVMVRNDQRSGWYRSERKTEINDAFYLTYVTHAQATSLFPFWCASAEVFIPEPPALNLFHVNNETHNYHIIIAVKMALTEIISRI